jgi:hypothetical protein
MVVSKRRAFKRSISNIRPLSLCTDCIEGRENRRREGIGERVRRWYRREGTREDRGENHDMYNVGVQIIIQVVRTKKKRKKKQKKTEKRNHSKVRTFLEECS